MAMTKKEKEAMEELELKLAMAKAMRMTSSVQPDVAPPSESFQLTTGWHFNSYARRVEVACSSVTGHAFGRIDKTNSQNSKWLYSTEKLALMAMRHEMELEFAKALVMVDKKIEGIEQ